ncbi:MAG: CYTH domain-containing protein [Bacteroidales bacterium]|jgi:adenylate cyclase|nr:CYTH domain-containing protein [Bacteroidales bacterium]
MAQEIERKFLVISDDYKTATEPVFIRQGFISTHKDHVVRVRIQGNKGFLALKGSGSGITRIEFEYEIPVEDAHQMLEAFCTPTIEKFRYKLLSGKHAWEVDEFLKENSGLTMAEIELQSEDEDFLKPSWLGKEVTGDPRYYNANLIDHPFCNW